MAANLTPQYLKAEAAYRRAHGLDEELACLQVMLRELPKHKGTDHLQAELRHKISKAKQELEAQARTAKKGFGVRIPRQGAGRVVIIGPPNAGKSRLLAALTRATPEIADYPFTTREPLVGMMPWEDISIQLIDTPPITPDVLPTYMQGLIRGADLVVLLADMGADEGGEQCAATRERLHQTKTHLGRSSYLDSQDLGRSATQTLLVLNKLDLPDAGLRQDLWLETLNWDLEYCAVSAQTGWGLDQLRSQIFRALDIVRVYTKQPQRKEPDYERPFTLRRGGTVADVAALVHQDFAERLKFALVWGHGVRPGTVVKGDHLLQDQDVVELHV